jgi:acyl-coenzyme A synthetase/AMP-(fatty) acid ligase
MAALQQQLTPLLPARFGAVKLIAVAKIPRTGNGKIQRSKLNAALQKIGRA